MDLYFASHNLNKVREIQSQLGDLFQIKSLFDLGIEDPIPETGTTLEENALLKARYLYNHHGVACFADDTGLIVPTLDGEPGVFSARYAGPEKDSAANMDLLLKRLEGKADRSAFFQTVMAYIDETGNEHTVNGMVHGNITYDKKGKDGFGYDPIFVPEGYEVTFAEMTLADKNKISHRARALKELVTLLRKKIGK